MNLADLSLEQWKAKMTTSNYRPIKAAVIHADPLGKVLAGPNFERETVLYGDIDLAAIPRGQV